MHNPNILSMKLYALSDIHLEFGNFEPPGLDVDVVILAGDIGVGQQGVEWANYYFPNLPTIYVLGNHEHYESNIQINIKKIKTIAENTNVHVLENESICINGVQFLGCTLWTDFNLVGLPRSSKNLATRYINDYDCIKFGPSDRKITTRDVQHMHTRSLGWLNKEICSNFDKRVIVTHHAPSGKSLPNNFIDENLTPAYASSLEQTVIESNADLWVHGHIHSSSDYHIGTTRVICNARGYKDGISKNYTQDKVIVI